MVKIGVVGCAGRMGQMIINAILDHPNADLSAGLEQKGNKLIGTNLGTLLNNSNINVLITDNMEDFINSCDVIIDFSSINSTLGLIEFLGNRGKKLVIGTTGFNEEQVTKIKKFGENNACVFSPNMSIGVNLLFSIVKNVASIIGERYDIEIIESHHNKKKDSPSGTAAKLAEVIADTLERNLDECGVYGRKGLVGERTKKEIGIHAVRAGDIVGEHTVMFAGPGERIELTHKAHTRDTFANGAVNAAVWLSEKNKGLFTMKEVLNLN